MRINTTVFELRRRITNAKMEITEDKPTGRGIRDSNRNGRKIKK